MIHETYHVGNKYQSMPGFDDRYKNIVDYILQITDDIWEKKKINVIHETYTTDVIIHIGAEIINGIETVVHGTIKTLESFPDRKMNGEAVIWSEDTQGRYFSSHRIGSSATNLGNTNYGDATGSHIFFRTIADCAVAENKIYEEWLVRDNFGVVEQLGFDPIAMAQLESKYNGKKSLAYDVERVRSLDTDTVTPKTRSEEVVFKLLQNGWARRDWDNMKACYHPDAVVHTIRNNDFSCQENSQFIKSIFDSFPDANLEILKITSINESEGEQIAVRWRIFGQHLGEGFFGSPTNVPVMFYGISHYKISDNLIMEEWCIFDAYDVMCQIYAEDKVVDTKTKKLAQIALEDKSDKLFNKVLIKTFLDALNSAIDRRDKLRPILEMYYQSDINTVFSDPIGVCSGIGELDAFWDQILRSFPDMEIQPYILIGGNYNGHEAVSIAGNLIGTFKEDWLTIPASHKPTYLRFSMQLIIEDGKIIKQWIYIDILSVIRQAGIQLFTSLGIDEVAPIPLTQDGITDYRSDLIETKKTFDLVNDMISGLLDYDQKDIRSMGMGRFWDQKSMMWYGPSAIGTTRGMRGFQNYHQIPFLHAFPNRGVNPDDDKTNYINIGDGNYACHFGHEVMTGNHSGDGWLGLKATNIDFTMSVMDFWRREGDYLVENWVMLDLVNVLGQFGVDVFKLMHDKLNNKSK